MNIKTFPAVDLETNENDENLENRHSNDHNTQSDSDVYDTDSDDERPSTSGLSAATRQRGIVIVLTDT